MQWLRASKAFLFLETVNTCSKMFLCCFLPQCCWFLFCCLLHLFFFFSFEICVKKIVAALFVSLRMHPLLFVFLLSFRVVINFTSKYLSRQYCLSRQIVTFLISAGDRAEEEVAHEKDCLDRSFACR